jgi:hypothetical protein
MRYASQHLRSPKHLKVKKRIQRKNRHFVYSLKWIRQIFREEDFFPFKRKDGEEVKTSFFNSEGEEETEKKCCV